ncbi:DUF7848 domain-containing protein [Streptomyces abikoensis]
MSRQRFRFDDWTTAPAPDASAKYEVHCASPVTEDGHLCGWRFSALDDKAPVEKAQRDHVEETGHRRFWEDHHIPTVVTAPPGSVVAGRIARYERAPR